MAGIWTSEAHAQRPPVTDVRTRQTVRLLMLRGLDRSEATNVTAFLCGIPVADRTWTLAEINRLLFLRELNRLGQFGPADESRAHGARHAA